MKTKLLSALLVCAGVLTGAAQATTFTVANGDVAGLIAAINAANDEAANPGADIVNLAANGIYTLTTADNGPAGTLTGLPVVISAITVNGNSAVIQRSTTITLQFRLLTVSPSGNLTLDDVTLRNGVSGRGGAILNYGALAISNSTVSNNSATFDFGGGISSSSLNSSPRLTVTNSTFSGNTASDGGGGIAVDTYAGGTSIESSTFVDNSSARGTGGAIRVLSRAGNTTIRNSTFSDNRASDGGGISHGTQTPFGLTLINSTLSGNSAGIFGGAISTSSSSSGRTVLRNTLLASNLAGLGGANCANVNSGFVTVDGGRNLDDGATCGFSNANGSFPNTNPLLDPADLRDNGGPTKTIALQSGSPAIDAIPQGQNGCGTDITKDQRGFDRPVDGNGDTVAACDIGAVEADIAATAAGTLQFISAASEVGEGGASITVPVSRTGGSDGEVSVSYTTGGGTATEGTDYTFTSGSLTWANNDNSSKFITLPIIDDGDFEGNETVNLTLSSPTGTAALGTPASATITIHDDETTKPGTLSFSATNYEVSEDAAIATITVTRSAGGDGQVSIDYATNTGGTATADVDYTETSGTLIWVGGDITNKTFSVPINDDLTVEGDETVSLTLGNATPGVTFGTAAATLTIHDNDVAHPGSLQFSAAAYNATEGDGSVQIIVRRMDGGDGAASVDYATGDGTATAGSDYTAASGTLTWSDGDTADKFFSVPVIDDTKFENDETVNLSLSTITGGATLGAPTAAVLTIADNDSAQPGSLQFSATAYSVNEGGGSATITVARAGGSDGQVSVAYTTSNGSATEGADYTFTSGFLTWADGDTADKSFSIRVINDTDVEGNETVNLALSNPDGGASLGSPAGSVLTIVDNDVSQQRSLRFSVASYGVNEGAGTAVITVTRAGGTVGRNSVRYSTAPGTATAGSDYKSKSGTLTWANGETASKSFSVSIIDDTKVETDETLNLRLSAPSNGAILGVPSSATLIITDNEGRFACEGLPATIVGTAGADNLKGTAGPDVIVGLDSVDVISGLGGDDVICGGAANDNIIGGAGNDRLFGEVGDDQLAGSGGADLLDGGADQDRCDGGAPRAGDTASNCEIIANVP